MKGKIKTNNLFLNPNKIDTTKYITLDASYKNNSRDRFKTFEYLKI